MRKKVGCFVLIVLLIAIAFGTWVYMGTRPTQRSAPFFIRFEKQAPLLEVLETLKDRGVVRNPDALRIYAIFFRRPDVVSKGTYELRGGLSPNMILNLLQKPVRQMVRIPETNWAARNANVLEQNKVCTAKEYLAEVQNPARYKDAVSFPLPASGTLEGYLFPDTYDFPPLLGAKEVVHRQLETFEKKVWEPLGKPTDLKRLVTVASLVELEVAKDEERPVVAGVIENRLKKGMRLQIDAAICYALGKWRPLTTKDYKDVDSPYNLYLHDGLPPGPICSPSLKSIEGALKPAEHKYLFYVALPQGNHLFSATYNEHLANIRKRKAAIILLRS